MLGHCHKFRNASFVICDQFLEIACPKVRVGAPGDSIAMDTGLRLGGA